MIGRRYLHRVIGALLCAACILVVGCGGGPLGRAAPLERWSSAVLGGDYARAADLMTEGDRALWLAETERLGADHGSVKEYTAGHVVPPPPGEEPMTKIRLVWADGFARCLLLREGPAGLATPRGGYNDCAPEPEELACHGISTPSGEPLRYRDGTDVCLTQAEYDRIPNLVTEGEEPVTTRTERDWRGRTSEVSTGGPIIDYRDVAEYLERQGKEVDLSGAATPHP